MSTRTFTAVEARAMLAAVRELHAPEKIDVITGPCSSEQCDHEQDCPTVKIKVCSECREITEAGNPYALEYPGATERTIYPCPTATKAGAA